MRKVIAIKDGVTRMPQWRMAEPVCFELREGEQLAIIGPNGGGKTKLVDIITGRHPLVGQGVAYDFGPGAHGLVSDNLHYIAFRDTYGGDNDRTYFLQQRWNQTEIDAETPTAHQALERAFLQAGADMPARRERQAAIYRLFHMEHFLDKYVVQLSSGELRKLKLAQTLFAEPRVLIMDNPFIGLDADTRRQLAQLLADIVRATPMQLILILCRTEDIPPFITRVVEVRDGKVVRAERGFLEERGERREERDLSCPLREERGEGREERDLSCPLKEERGEGREERDLSCPLKEERGEGREERDLSCPLREERGEGRGERERSSELKEKRQKTEEDRDAPQTDHVHLQELADHVHLQEQADSSPSISNPVIEMRGVHIQYGTRTILDSLDWTVRQGEHWALSGQNGAGKSTLLSLVCADNPQAYACDITLFGHRRGSGESIWDIKRHIGYVSPELHRSYHRDIATLRVVASGLKDTVGLYARPTDSEMDECRRWLRVFGLADKADTSFLQLSSGEQRLALVARAFVKSPDLLILDEPLHGLDDGNRQLVRDVIERYCSDPRRTLIMVSHYEEELPPCIDHRLHLLRHA